MKKILALMTAFMLIFLMSCSEDETSSGDKNDSQNLQNEMSGVTQDIMETQGGQALTDNMNALMYLDFTTLVMKNISKVLDKAHPETEIEQYAQIRDIFSKTVSQESPKQSDHFVLAEWAGTYTFAGYVYQEGYEGDPNYIIGANWNVVTGGTEIIVVIPAEYTPDQYEFRMELHDYQDVFMEWYDEYEYYYSDWYPTLVDFDIYMDGDNVFGFDLSAEWSYVQAQEDVIPTYLEVYISMPPFDIEVIVGTGSTYLSYGIYLSENDNSILSMDLDINFMDVYWDETEDVNLYYTSESYTIQLYEDYVYEDYLMSENYTMQGEVDMINDGEHIFVKIWDDDDDLIGELKAKIEYNEETGYDEIVFYIEFTDGSTMSMEDFVEIFGLTEDDIYGFAK